MNKKRIRLELQKCKLGLKIPEDSIFRSSLAINYIIHGYVYSIRRSVFTVCLFGRYVCVCVSMCFGRMVIASGWDNRARRCHRSTRGSRCRRGTWEGTRRGGNDGPCSSSPSTGRPCAPSRALSSPRSGAPSCRLPAGLACRTHSHSTLCLQLSLIIYLRVTKFWENC